MTLQLSPTISKPISNVQTFSGEAHDMNYLHSKFLKFHQLCLRFISHEKLIFTQPKKSCYFLTLMLSVSQFYLQFLWQAKLIHLLITHIYINYALNINYQLQTHVTKMANPTLLRCSFAGVRAEIITSSYYQSGFLHMAEGHGKDGQANNSSTEVDY